MMAFSALSMAHSTGVQNLDALQHYQQALPSLQYSLQSPADLSSDGTLLTHFTLLLYEVRTFYDKALSVLLIAPADCSSRARGLQLVVAAHKSAPPNYHSEARGPWC